MTKGPTELLYKQTSTVTTKGAAVNSLYINNLCPTPSPTKVFVDTFEKRLCVTRNDHDTREKNSKKHNLPSAAQSRLLKHSSLWCGNATLRWRQYIYALLFPILWSIILCSWLKTWIKDGFMNKYLFYRYYVQYQTFSCKNTGIRNNWQWNIEQYSITEL